MSPALPDVEAVNRISAVPTILELMVSLTGMRFATVARVTDETWTACAVIDNAGLGVEPGTELPLHTTLCHEVRRSGSAIAFGHASEDAVYREHPTPKLYGFESYISLPIVRADGSFFGTLCSLDPSPKVVNDPALIRTLTLFAQLIATNLDADVAIQRKTRELETARADTAMRDQFVAVLGHDLRNPLNSIGISAEVLETRVTEPKARAMVAVIRRSCTRMAGLIDDVLDFARGTLGSGIPVTLEDSDLLATLLRQVVSEIQLGNPDRAITSELDLPGIVRCDAPRIAQLAGNLLANAMAHGEPATGVSLTAKAADGVFTLSVHNQGPEIPADLLPRIFEPFVRAASNRTRSGLGLGLYIAAAIAHGHHGVIAVVSNAQRGTTFTFTMPLGGH